MPHKRRIGPKLAENLVLELGVVLYCFHVLILLINHISSFDWEVRPKIKLSGPIGVS